MDVSVDKLNLDTRYRHSSMAIRYDYLISSIILLSLLLSSLSNPFAALIFLVSGLFHAIKQYRYTLAAIQQCYPLFLFSLVGIASMFWSDLPLLSLKRGIQIFLTTLICVSLIYSVKKEVIITTLTLCLVMVILWALSSSKTVIISYTGEMIRIGHFGSKNSMSSFAAFSAMVGISTWLLPSLRPSVKLLGGVCTLLSIVVFYCAKSLGTNLSFFIMLALSSAIYIYSNRNFSIINRSAFNALSAGYFALFTISAFYFFDFSYYEELMYSLGKDPTITGRTIIWDVGFHSISENPLLGVGYGAYWNEDNAGALEIWQLLHKEVGDPFGFHNLYVHYYVELGLLGLIAILGVLGSCIKQAYLRATHGLDLFDIFIFCLLLFFFAKSFFETGGFAQFHFSHFSLCLIWMSLNKKTFFDCGKKTIIVFEGKA